MSPLARLAWLPVAPADFATQVKALRASDEPVGSALRALATHALDANHLQRLARLARERESGLTPFRLGIVSNATTDFIVPAIVGSGLRHGLHIECVTGSYGQVMQDALDPASAVNRAECDAVLLALDAHTFALSAPPGDAAGAQAALESALAQFDAVCAGLGQHCPTLIVQTVPLPADRHLGSYDAVLAGAPSAQIDALNRALGERCARGEAALFDVAWLAAGFGLSEWQDDAAWHLAKQAFAHTALPTYGEGLARLLAAIRGKSRKALVLDLDNTVWSGVIGDDGMDGINIAQGDATGEAHLALQRYALELRERGVLLAVSSKNEDDVARAVFRDHPDMLLRESHIAVFQANWNDKASNLRAIAEMLDIGIDALVFVDDNPAERAQVRQALPEVAVPEMPDNPAGYVRTLAAGGYFEATGFSAEDRARAQMYGENASRAALQVSSGGIEDYLRSLTMTIRFAPFDIAGRARIAQLINKSNQFNLTTRRYSEPEVAALTCDPEVATLQVRLEDAFGDNGMIAVVICRAHGSDWEIDTWLMSCRVLGRRVEQAVMAQLHRLAAARGIERLVGLFRPSGRNQIVAGHYSGLGFALDREDDEGNQTWVMPVDKTGADPTSGLFAATIADGFGTGDRSQ